MSRRGRSTSRCPGPRPRRVPSTSPCWSTAAAATPPRCRLATAAPGLFYDPTSGAAIVQNSRLLVEHRSNPAPRGGTIVAYLTGSGPVSPATKDGTLAPTTYADHRASRVLGEDRVRGGEGLFTGLTPGFIGLVQMNIVVPSTLTPGVYPLTVTIDGQTSNSATIAVK